MESVVPVSGAGSRFRTETESRQEKSQQSHPGHMSTIIDPPPLHVTETLNDPATLLALSPDSGLFPDPQQPPTVMVGPSPIEYAATKAHLWPQLNSKQWSDNMSYALIYSASRGKCLPNHIGARISVPTRLRLDNWDIALAEYHDKQLCDYIRYGWPVGYTSTCLPAPVNKNHTSADRHAKHVQDYIDKEIELGGIIGPFLDPPFTPWFHTAPLMTRPKSHSSSRRVILDLSYPEPHGVNAGIIKNCLEGHLTPYTLPSAEDLCTKLAIIGKSAYIWKLDLARAYHQFRADPGDLPLLGLRFKGKYYIETSLSFGSRLSGAACQRASNAVIYLLAKAGHWGLAYLDDYCGAAASEQEAKDAYEAIHKITEFLGLELSADKCAPPSKQMDWLGFHFDTDQMTITIPQDKLHEILTECQQWMNSDRATKKQMQSLAGKLVHVAKCVRPARKFISRILESLRKAPEYGMVPVSHHFRQDVRWFLQYSIHANGRHLIQPTLEEIPIECDSSKVGGGGNSDTAYYSKTYSKAYKQQIGDICHLEAANLVTAYRTLAPTDAQGKKVVIYTDNTGSKYALESGRTHDRILAACSRQMWLEAATRDQLVEIRHKPGAELLLADALSRQHIKSKRALSKSLVKQRGLIRVKPQMPCPFFTSI